jgi:hypothetical protein
VDNFAKTPIPLDPFEPRPLILDMTQKNSKPRPRRTDKSADALRENLMKRKAQARARAEQTKTEKK